MTSPASCKADHAAPEVSPSDDITALMARSPKTRETRRVEFRPVTAIMAERLADPGQKTRFVRSVQQMRAQSSQTLIVRLGTTEDDLTRWALHCTLDSRGIAPSYRWPSGARTAQAEFIDQCADLYWLASRHLDHSPTHRGWRPLFTTPRGTRDWHHHAYRQLAWAHRKHQRARYLAAVGLGVSESQRLELATMPTVQIAADRRSLQPEAFEAIRQALLDHAMTHPDRSRQRSPEAVAHRRASLWRTFVLSGHSSSETAKAWFLLSGERLTRQAVAKQIEAVQVVLRLGAL